MSLTDYGLVALAGGVFLIAAAFFYWNGLTSMVAAWSRAEYSYGYMVPFISAYMLTHRLTNALKSQPNHEWVAIVIAVLAVLLGLLGNLTRIEVFSSYGFIVAIAALAVGILGLSAACRIWEPILHLFFMIPLPGIIYLKLSSSMQLISSELGVAFIRVLGIPVLLEGNIIDLGIYSLQVAEACSGLRYMFPLMSFGFLFAVIYRGPGWQKWVLFISTMPITIVMNSFRIGAIGVLVEAYGIEQAEGFIHFFEGWVIFLACTAVLFLETYILLKLTGASRTLRDSLHIGYIPLPSLQTILARGGRLTPLIAVIILLPIGAVALETVAPDRSQSFVPDRAQLAGFPSLLGEWKGHKSGLTQEVLDVLGADDYLLADYRRRDEANGVNIFVAFYNRQSEGRAIHSPEVCIPGAGWEISVIKAYKPRLDGSDRTDMVINRAIIQKGLQKNLVYFWFQQRGKKRINEYAVKWNILWDGITIGRTDGALVRLVTAIDQDTGVGGADRRLTEFLDAIDPIVPEFVPN